MKSEMILLCFALLVWAAEGEHSVWAGLVWPGEDWWSPLPAPSSLSVNTKINFKGGRAKGFFTGFQSCSPYPCKHGATCKINLRGEAYCE